mmetsp:Transcript_63858/g.149940  ORF Transcript_63858/g.149940 Transcript_63858/m.149940 type:complete len:295 (+) Transcript_63858:1659-2543(+)
MLGVEDQRHCCATIEPNEVSRCHVDWQSAKGNFAWHHRQNEGLRRHQAGKELHKCKHAHHQLLVNLLQVVRQAIDESPHGLLVEEPVHWSIQQVGYALMMDLPGRCKRHMRGHVAKNDQRHTHSSNDHENTLHVDAIVNERICHLRVNPLRHHQTLPKLKNRMDQDACEEQRQVRCSCGFNPPPNRLPSDVILILILSEHHAFFVAILFTCYHLVHVDCTRRSTRGDLRSITVLVLLLLLHALEGLCLHDLCWRSSFDHATVLEKQHAVEVLESLAVRLGDHQTGPAAHHWAEQ